MKKTLLIIQLATCALVFGFFTYPKVDRYFRSLPARNSDNLRTEIINSIKNPFLITDTLILESTRQICGNSDPNEIPITFDTRLDDYNYISLLSQKLNIPIVTMNDFQKVMDSVSKYKYNNEYVPSLWDSCRVGKVSAEILAEQFSPTEIRLHEYYNLNDTAKFVTKKFSFERNKWTFKVMKTSTLNPNKQ